MAKLLVYTEVSAVRSRVRPYFLNNQKDYKLKRDILIMEKNMIKISLREYEGMKETIEILQNPDTMHQILESEDNIRKGKVKEFKY